MNPNLIVIHLNEYTSSFKKDIQRALDYELACRNILLVETVNLIIDGVKPLVLSQTIKYIKNHDLDVNLSGSL